MLVVLLLKSKAPETTTSLREHCHSAPQVLWSVDWAGYFVLSLVVTVVPAWGESA